VEIWASALDGYPRPPGLPGPGVDLTTALWPVKLTDLFPASLSQQSTAHCRTSRPAGNSNPAGI